MLSRFRDWRRSRRPADAASPLAAVRSLPAEQALRESEARLSLALDAANAGVVDWNVETGSVHLRGTYVSVLGLPTYSERGIALVVERVHPDDRRAVEDAIAISLADDARPFDLTFRLVAGDDARWYHGIGRVVERGAGGEPRRATATIVDVTASRQATERLRFMDRIASLGTLAAGLAHEIRNPLAYLVANLEHVAGELGRTDRASGDAGLADAAREALEGAARIDDIVRGLNVFAAPQPDLPAEPVDLADAVRLAAKLTGAELRGRARLVLDLGEVPRVAARPSEIGQVILNLVVNAAQAIPRGAPGENAVTVRTRPAPDGRVAVEVSDTGAGIPDHVLPRIFDPFFTTKPAGEGTGLGLAICHGIVTSLGGEIRVATQAGAGTTFTVLLPPAERAAAPEATAAAVARVG